MEIYIYNYCDISHQKQNLAILRRCMGKMPKDMLWELGTFIFHVYIILSFAYLLATETTILLTLNSNRNFIHQVPVAMWQSCFNKASFF